MFQGRSESEGVAKETTSNIHVSESTENGLILLSHSSLSKENLSAILVDKSSVTSFRSPIFDVTNRAIGSLSKTRKTQTIIIHGTEGWGKFSTLHKAALSAIPSTNMLHERLRLLTKSATNVLSSFSCGTTNAISSCATLLSIGYQTRPFNSISSIQFRMCFISLRTLVHSSSPSEIFSILIGGTSLTRFIRNFNLPPGIESLLLSMHKKCGDMHVSGESKTDRLSVLRRELSHFAGASVLNSVFRSFLGIFHLVKGIDAESTQEHLRVAAALLQINPEVFSFEGKQKDQREVLIAAASHLFEETCQSVIASINACYQATLSKHLLKSNDAAIHFFLPPDTSSSISNDFEDVARDLLNYRCHLQFLTDSMALEAVDFYPERDYRVFSNIISNMESAITYLYKILETLTNSPGDEDFANEVVKILPVDSELSTDSDTIKGVRGKSGELSIFVGSRKYAVAGWVSSDQTHADSGVSSGLSLISSLKTLPNSLSKSSKTCVKSHSTANTSSRVESLLRQFELIFQVTEEADRHHICCLQREDQSKDVVSQMQRMHLNEIASSNQHAVPVRPSHNSFVSDYGRLLKSSHESSRCGSQLLLQKLASEESSLLLVNDYFCGDRRVVARPHAKLFLEGIKNRLLVNRVVRIQAAVRSHLTRKRVAYMKQLEIELSPYVCAWTLAKLNASLFLYPTPSIKGVVTGKQLLTYVGYLQYLLGIADNLQPQYFPRNIEEARNAFARMRVEADIVSQCEAMLRRRCSAKQTDVYRLCKKAHRQGIYNKSLEKLFTMLTQLDSKECLERPLDDDDSADEAIERVGGISQPPPAAPKPSDGCPPRIASSKDTKQHLKVSQIQSEDRNLSFDTTTACTATMISSKPISKKRVSASSSHTFPRVPPARPPQICTAVGRRPLIRWICGGAIGVRESRG